MTYSDLDATVSISGAFALEAQTASAGISHELHALEGEEHTSFNLFVTEVAPSVTLFDQLVTFLFARVAPRQVPATLGLGVAIVCVGMLAIARRALGVSR